ncbi:hypothetical protein NIES4075_19230 [Tolypothrix sp. NIES-4075]|uniref:hypothetical protein n=1 Tax=Tolypothrix sp. NIES-4075 TaxID=2005459 RepID=UPI000B626C14|nr:hypothetical protein [Tolypothrix sp. NIES-4075]GAX40956.1 hypothetical protein NIES4075_19230 [Tolypothrix sp. NIES-4075]
MQLRRSDWRSLLSMIIYDNLLKKQSNLRLLMRRRFDHATTDTYLSINYSSPIGGCRFHKSPVLKAEAVKQAGKL